MRTPRSSPARSATSAMTCHSGRTPRAALAVAALRPPDRGPQALHAAVGVRERALLLGVGLGGEDDVGVLADRVGQHRVDARSRSGRCSSAASQAARSGWVRSGSAWSSQTRRELAAASAAAMPARRGRARRASRSRGRGRARSRPRAGRGRWRRRAPRAGPAPSRPARPRRAATLSSARRRLGAARTGEQPLAVDDHDVLGALEEVGQLARRACALVPAALARAAEVAAVARQRGVERDAAAPRRRPARGAASSSALVSSAVGRALTTPSAHAVAAHALADAQVPDRRVVDRVAVEEQHRVGELEVGHRRLQRRVGERARDVERQLAAGRGVRCRSRAPRASSLASRNASSLVVSPPASAAALAPAFFSAPAAAASAFSQHAGCSSCPRAPAAA